MRNGWSYSWAVYVHVVTTLILAVACGDDAAAEPWPPLPPEWVGAAGSAAPPSESMRGQTQSRCISGQFAGLSNQQVAASMCFGFPLAYENKADFRCDPLPTPGLAGLVGCQMPDLGVNYLVQWRSSTEARAIQDDAVVATLQTVGPNTFAVRYENGRRGNCEIRGDVLNFCAILN